MRVLLADPPAFTPPYDHALASALARAGAEVELVTSPFRFGEAPAPDGYRRSELFYPVSSKVFRRSRLRIPVKLLEHPVGLMRLRRRKADVVHLQWLAAPELDDRLLRVRAPLVFTAHDILPRRTADKRDLWQRLFGRFARVVVHSERARGQLEELVELDRIRVIPHPVFPSDPVRRDDGRTLLSLGIIREYKGLGDAIEATKRIDGGVPVVAYDVGGIAEPVRRFEAGRVVPPGDLDALTGAARGLVDDPAALERARAGAERARRELTWDAAAQAHLELYRELL